jgi:hypothetical protein
MRRRRTTFTQMVTDAHRPLQAQERQRDDAAVRRYGPVLNGDISDEVEHILQIVASTLACGVFGLGVGLLTEAVTNGRVNGTRLAYGSTGLTIIVSRIAGSQTIREWADWAVDLQIARRMQEQQGERQRLAWRAQESAAKVVSAVSSQPKRENGVVNDTVTRVLRDYYRAKAVGREGEAKLWSRRNLQEQYGLGQWTKANRRVRELLEPIADGYRLKAVDYAMAFRALFGCEPDDWFARELERIADNPATGEPVLVPKRRMANLEVGESMRMRGGLVLTRTK